MASVKDLRDRIRSLKNTQQITKAMKQVAAAKIRRAELAQKQARPYADTISEMLRDLVAGVGSVDHPFMKPGAQGAPAGLVLMTADKGLAGAFNSNVIRVVEQAKKKQPDAIIYAVGVKARNAAKRLGQPDAASWTLGGAEKINTARDLAQRISDDFIAGKIFTVTLISQKFVSTMVQRPESKQLLPIQAGEISTTTDQSAPKAAVEFSPSPEAVLAHLLPKYLEFTLFSAMLETDAAFFAAQLVAMNNATDNAGKLIDELTIVMNNARQAAITKELLEIVAGAEALTG